MRLQRLLGTGLLVSGGFLSHAWGATPAENLKQILAVGPKGTGHTAAQAAVRDLSKADESALVPILDALGNASPLASNWLRGVFETIADRSIAAKKLPAAQLEAFILDTKHGAAARRLAYEWLLKVDATASDRLIPGMLQDASAEFRRDAVARLLEQAGKATGPEQVALYKQALIGAVDDDQVKAIVKPLRDAGEKVDLQLHFGFLPAWQLIGPFDNTDKKGFDVAYPPESELKFDAKYPGKKDDVAWTEFRTTDEYGVVDLAKALAPHKGAVTYAATEFASATAQTVEVRLGTPNAWKLWVNGQLAFARDEYHRGTMLDQYKVPVKLQAGKNTLLLKVCQNEQTEDWAQKWQYQLRICTSAGSAVHPQTAALPTRPVTVAQEGR